MAAPLPTREDFFAVGARELLARQVGRPPAKRVTAAAVYTTGTNVNSALAAAAAMADEVMRHEAIRLNELFLDSSEDEALERLIADHIDPDLVRKQPSRAVVSLKLARGIPPSDGSVQTIAADSIVRTKAGVEFRLVSDVNFALNALGPIDATAQAVVAGTTGNVDESTITEFAAQPADTGIYIVQAEPAAGGGDLETNQDYLARAKAARKAQARGIIGAIELGAWSVPGIKAVLVEEVTDSTGELTGQIRLYIADAAGRANTALVAQVREALTNYRAAGIPVDVQPTAPYYATIAYTLPVQAGYDGPAAIAQLKALVLGTVNLLKPGQPLQRSLLLALARSVPGLIVSDGCLTLPATDVTPMATQTIRTRMDLITVNGG